MDTTSDPEYYAWAVFLHWLDRRAAGSGFAFVRAVNEAKAADLATLDAAGKKALGEPLADVFEKFARDFYHGDVWSGAIMPILHRDTARNQALAQHCRDRDRTFVLTRVGAEENDWAIAHTPPVKPLTAHAMITQVEGLSPHLKGKLVVTVSGTTNPDLAVHLAKDSVSPKLPSSGAPGEFEAFSPAAGGKASRVIEGVGSSKGINRVTVLFVNKSLARDAGTFGVERWLLVPPDTVTSERERPGQTQWKVRWDRVGLQSCPQAFKGYNVYRRKAGEPDSAYRLVREDVTEAWCLDTAPDAEDYAYTVKVKDVLGNLSEPAPNDLGDPFQGDWEGEVALVNGEFARPIVSALRDKQAEQEKKALAALAREKDPARRTSGQQDLARERESMTQFIAMVEKFLTMAEDLARLGIPAVLRIQRVDGQYQLSIPEVMWQATDAKEGAKMKRVGPHTLAFVEQPKDFPPLYLRLHRKDEIREREWKVRHMEDGKTYEFSFRWSFKRKE
jgi:hypothetical protein